MKLIFSVDSISPPLTGIGRYALELARGLARKSYPGDVRFFLHGRFVSNPAFSRHFSANADAPPHLPSLPRRLRSAMARSVPMINLYGALSPAWFAWCLRQYSDYLFHSPNYFLPPVSGPAIATFHDLSTLLYPEFHPAARVARMHSGLNASLRRASHLITVSEFVRTQVIEHLNWPAERVSTISLGVDPRFHPRSAMQTQAVLSLHGLLYGSYILCVATIEPRKNIERLIDAHRALPEALRVRHPLVLVGSSGWNSDALHTKIVRLQGKNVRYLHYVTESHLHAIYAGARLFAFPSIYEGFGLPVLEAMASGVAVLTSDRASLPEVGGHAVFQVNPYDVDAIRDGLRLGLQDAQWRQEAIAQGLLRARQFSWQRCVDQTLRLYQKYAPATVRSAM